jgi:hypothetical protein
MSEQIQVGPFRYQLKQATTIRGSGVLIWAPLGEGAGHQALPLLEQAGILWRARTGWERGPRETLRVYLLYRSSRRMSECWSGASVALAVQLHRGAGRLARFDDYSTIPDPEAPARILRSLVRYRVEGQWALKALEELDRWLATYGGPMAWHAEGSQDGPTLISNGPRHTSGQV